MRRGLFQKIWGEGDFWRSSESWVSSPLFCISLTLEEGELLLEARDLGEYSKSLLRRRFRSRVQENLLKTDMENSRSSLPCPHQCWKGNVFEGRLMKSYIVLLYTQPDWDHVVLPAPHRTSTRLGSELSSSGQYKARAVVYCLGKPKVMNAKTMQPTLAMDATVSEIQDRHKEEGGQAIVMAESNCLDALLRTKGDALVAGAVHVSIDEEFDQKLQAISTSGPATVLLELLGYQLKEVGPHINRKQESKAAGRLEQIRGAHQVRMVVSPVPLKIMGLLDMDNECCDEKLVSVEVQQEEEYFMKNIGKLAYDEIRAMVFDSENDVVRYYYFYARLKGFYARKDEISRDYMGSIMMRQLCVECNDEVTLTMNEFGTPNKEITVVFYKKRFTFVC
ncbi:hypothetical protein VNO77_27055 [Canavalia gladiata]|uniref:Uncharacterized protein n=1 Tax=Canavalia gladiata TaxID=3824 RepID=A0AAN9KWI8_CANGL